MGEEARVPALGWSDCCHHLYVSLTPLLVPTQTFPTRTALITPISLTCAFLLVAAFFPPSADSAFSYAATHVQWYIVPTVGLATLLAGIAYFSIFRYVIPRLKGKELFVGKTPVVVSNKYEEMVMRYEVIEFEWRVPD